MVGGHPDRLKPRRRQHGDYQGIRPFGVLYLLPIRLCYNGHVALALSGKEMSPEESCTTFKDANVGRRRLTASRLGQIVGHAHSVIVIQRLEAM